MKITTTVGSALLGLATAYVAVDAVAAEPVVKAAPSAPSPAPGPVVSVPRPPKLKINALRFDNTAKLKVIGPILGSAVAEKDLDTPFTIDVRHPFINADTYLVAAGLAWYDLSSDEPVLSLLPDSGGAGHPFVAVQFKAAANRAYLVDCSLLGAGPYSQLLSVSGSPDERITINPRDGHATAVVRKAPTARTVNFSLHMSSVGMTFSGCELTPVK